MPDQLKKTDSPAREEEMVGARRATGVSSSRADADSGTGSDPEVLEKPKRRRFTATEKLRILGRADACTREGEIGALLRSEGLYSSHLSNWRRQRESGALMGLAPNKRGPKPNPTNEQIQRNVELERENQRLRERLAQAETIIEVQKKVSSLLGIPLNQPPTDASD